MSSYYHPFSSRHQAHEAVTFSDQHSPFHATAFATTQLFHPTNLSSDKLQTTQCIPLSILLFHFSLFMFPSSKTTSAWHFRHKPNSQSNATKSYFKIDLALSASTCVGLSRLLVSPWPSWPQQLLPHVNTACSTVTMATWELPTATFKKKCINICLLGNIKNQSTKFLQIRFIERNFIFFLQ